MRKRLPRLADDVLPKLLVPTRRLDASDRTALLAFYRRVSMSDRAAHFGHPLSDDKLAIYISKLDFEADGHFAAFGAASVMIGVAHCTVFDGQGVVLVHVAHGYRWRGIGERLGEMVVRFGRAQRLNWLRAYFRKDDAVAASLARRCGLALNVGIDRFYAELQLAPVARNTPATDAARALRGLQLTDDRRATPVKTAAVARPERLRSSGTADELSEGLGRAASHAVGREPSHQVA